MKIAVFDTNILPEFKARIQSVASEPVDFPRQRCDNEKDRIARTGDADTVLIGPWDKITAEYLNACPSIRNVCICGTSTANANVDELKKRNIAFKNVVDYGDEPAAEFIFMQLAGLLHGVGPYQWKPERHELMGKSVGIIGLGALGKAIAHMALAYKMDTSYFSLHRKLEHEKLGVLYRDLPDMLEKNEIIVISTPTNVQVLGNEEFDLLRPGSIVVQASVGNAVNREAFLSWIAQDGNYAIFDKSAGEENYHAYKDLPRVIFADVIAGYTHETLERLYEKVIDNLEAFSRRERVGERI
jgi:phosphoglycerate dehydrogenase-like enzyme